MGKAINENVFVDSDDCDRQMTPPTSLAMTLTIQSNDLQVRNATSRNPPVVRYIRAIAIKVFA